MKRYRFISEVLNAVAKTKTRKEKIKILQFNNSMQLKKIFRLAYHPDFTYIKIPNYEKIENGLGMQLIAALQFIENHLTSGNLTGRIAERAVKNMLISVTAEEAEILEMVLKKDMQCGVGKSIAKKVWGKDLYK